VQTNLQTVKHWDNLPLQAEAGLSLRVFPPSELCAYKPSPQHLEQEMLNHAVDHCLIPNTRRITHLDLRIPHQMLSKVFALPHDAFTELEELKLSRKDDISFSMRQDLGSAFISAPRLRRVVLRSLEYMCLCDLPLPWAQLTDVSLDGQGCQQSAEEYFALQSKCTSLLQWNLYNISFVDKDAVPRLPTTIPTLQSLILHFAEPANAGMFIRMLTLPNLRHLEVFCTHWQVSDYIPFLSAMSSTLETFKVAYPPSHLVLPGNYHNLFSCVPSPSAVTVELSGHCQLSDSTLQEIASGELLPRLEHLRIYLKEESP
jgi:hypothetical protein